jgi:hypothetical protein
MNSIAMDLIRVRNLHYVEQGMWLRRRRTMLKSRMRKKRKERKDRETIALIAAAEIYHV